MLLGAKHRIGLPNTRDEGQYRDILISKSKLSQYLKVIRKNNSHQKRLTLIPYVAGVNYSRPHLHATWNNRKRFGEFSKKPLAYVCSPKSQQVNKEMKERNTQDLRM